MKVLVLAGGLGKRLRTVIGDRPKCMALIDKKPFLEYLVLQLKKYRLNEIILSTGHQERFIREYFGSGSMWSVNVSYSLEKKPLGTAGAIKQAEEVLTGDDFFVMNGDSFFDIDMSAMIDFHRHKKALATMALTKVRNPQRYGNVVMGEDNEITEFSEKSKKPNRHLINGGVYCFSKKIFAYMQRDRKTSLENEIFPMLVGCGFYGIVSNAYFIDIGTPISYRTAQKALADYVRKIP